MKRYSTLLLILFFLSNFSLNAQNRWIEDQQMKFKISIPNSYQTNEFWDGTDKIHAFVSADQNVAIRVRSIPVQSSISIDMIEKAFSQNIIKGAQQIVNQAYTLNGVNGEMAAYKWKYNKINVVIGAFYTIQSNIAYVVWTMVPEQLLAKRNAESDAITNSFTVSSGNTQNGASVQSGGLGSLGGINNFFSQTEQPVNIQITDIAIGTEVSFDLFIDHPLSVVDPVTEKLFCVFGYKGNAKGKTFITKWYNETSNKQFGESPFFPGDIPSGRVQSSLDRPGSNWEEGNYRVEIWLDSQKLDQKFFVVSGTAIDGMDGTIPSQVAPEGFIELVSDDVCIEHWIPDDYHVEGADRGQKIWKNGSGINMVQQVIFKESDFRSFMDNHLSELASKGAEIVGSDYIDSNGLIICQYIYKYGNSVFSYLSSENNNVFYLLGFVGNSSVEDQVIGYSNTIINSFKKLDCPN